MKNFRVALIFILVACAQSQPITAPSGNKGYVIDCNSNYTSISTCYKKASEMCPYGYVVESKDQEEYMAIRSLIISCKPKTQKQAQEEQKNPASSTSEGCMNDQACGAGYVCATIRGEYPGSCVQK